MQKEASFVVTEEFNGTRLDFALKNMGVSSGIRPARRLINENMCLVNDKPELPHYRIRTNDIIRIIVKQADTDTPEPLLIKDAANFLFYYKPAKIHTSLLSGKNNFSIERWLKNTGQNSLTLLQRLDYNTRGILTCAKNNEAIQLFKNYENKGLCDKFYLCLLDNNPVKPFTAFVKLDTKNRKKTRITDNKADFIRQTQFFPLPDFIHENSVWCICRIKRGARHQIRAHAAACGHPLTGDTLYGGSSGCFFLWNFLLSFPGFFIKSPIKSSLPQSLSDAAFLISSKWDHYFDAAQDYSVFINQHTSSSGTIS